MALAQEVSLLSGLTCNAVVLAFSHYNNLAIIRPARHTLVAFHPSPSCLLLSNYSRRFPYTTSLLWTRYHPALEIDGFSLGSCLVSYCFQLLAQTLAHSKPWYFSNGEIYYILCRRVFGKCHSPKVYSNEDLFLVLRGDLLPLLSTPHTCYFPGQPSYKLSLSYVGYTTSYRY